MFMARWKVHLRALRPAAFSARRSADSELVDWDIDFLVLGPRLEFIGFDFAEIGSYSINLLILKEFSHLKSLNVGIGASSGLHRCVLALMCMRC